MSNLATIVNNILADSGIDDLNVVVTNGSYSNPSWITALAWSKITGTPTTLAGYGITNGVPTSRTLTINGVSYDLSADRTWTIASGVTSVNAGTGISVNATTGAVTVTNTGVLSINGSTGAVTGILTTSNYTSYAVAAYGTSAGDIDADWGQSFRTFDPIPSGTPPIQSPNIRTINVGNDYNRRTQIAFDYASTRSWFRRRNDGGWSAWAEYIHSLNYTNYSPTLTGGGASGTWGINITGNADTVDGYHLDQTLITGASPTWTTGNFRGDINVGIWGNSSNVNMYDGDEGTRVLHCNSNRIGFLTQAGSWGAYCDDAGNWAAANFSGSSSGTNTGDQTNISGNAATATLASKASTLAQNGGNGSAMTFNWSGQGGQPTWLWGSNNGTDIYVWNPSNFSVNYANSAGSASSTTTATRLDGTANGATFYTNNASYGAWRSGGSRNGWYGIEFENQMNLMMNTNESGHHNNSYGWQFRWSNGTFYIGKNSFGGNEATVLDSSNASYAWNMNQYVRTSDAPTFSDVYVNGWFRNNTYNTGLYSQNTTQHWSSKDNGYWDASSTNSVSSIRLWTGGHISALRGYLYANTSNEIGFLGADGNWTMRTVSGGNCFCHGTLYSYNDVIAYYSDERLKTKTGKIENALEKVCSLEAFTYTHNDLAVSLGYDNNKESQIGLSAQEVQKIAPELVALAGFDVATDEEGNKYSKSGENYLTIKYDRLVPLLIEAIKEQQKQIDELKAKLG